MNPEQPPGCPEGATCKAVRKVQPCEDNGKSVAGGDWPGLNRDAHNSRHQGAEDVIGTDNVSDLVPAWTFTGEQVGATGGMRSTPVVANGCVYLGLGLGYLGDRGDVIALDAATGKVIWHTRVDGSVLGLAVANGLVYATPSLGTRGNPPAPVVTDGYAPGGTSVVALDAATGEVAWTSERLDDGNPGNGTFINASPVAYEAAGLHLLFVPLSGGAGDGARVPMYFLDALTGETVRKAYSLTDEEYEAGFGGTGIWATAAYDAATEHLYAGTADSDGKTRQHPHNNAILKIDANPLRPTFATIVDAYQGTSEHADLDAFVGHPNNPGCTSAGVGGLPPPPTFFDTSASVECFEFDFDFGASPNLYRDSSGSVKVAALQKSGIFHVVDTADMTADWTFTVGPGGAAMDAGTSAADDARFYVRATPDLLFGLDRADGTADWLSTTALDVFAYQPVSVANGVLYSINDSGYLIATDADSGTPLTMRSISTDGSFSHCLGVGAGVAIALHTIFVPCDAGGTVDLAAVETAAGGLVAYRLAD